MQRNDAIFKRFIRRNVILAIIGLLCLGASPSAGENAPASVAAELIAEGKPDECFYKVGSWDNIFNPEDLTEEQIKECLEQGGALKQNAGYVWSLTKSGDSLWFGTGSNLLQVGLGIMLSKGASGGSMPFERLIPAFHLPGAVFELDKSSYMNGELGFMGDYRPPRIFAYNLNTGTLTDQTPDDPLLYKTYGLRSAGYLNGVAILAGPVLYNDDGIKGINLFAFDTENKTYLGSRNIYDLRDDHGQIIAEGINNIRKWLEIKGALYTTVGTETGGKVLRWTGSVQDPFRFEVIADLEDQGTDLVYHENRLFIMTWPPSDGPAGYNVDGSDFSNVCDIMMTKEAIPEGGLTPDTEFVSVWNARDYEPDLVTGATYGIGAAASFDGYLYWGTMHVPLTSGVVHLSVYPRDRRSLQGIIDAFVKTHRQTAVFRGKNFASGHPEIELLYGDEMLFQYQPDARRKKRWKAVPNNMGQKPLFGPSGFGNKANVYTWSMAVYNNQLFLGTSEMLFPEDSDKRITVVSSRLLNGIIRRVSNAVDDAFRDMLAVDEPEPGFNLYRFKDAESPAILETDDGYGRAGTNAVRNLLADDDAMYLGTAGSFSLHPTGGWSLFKITIPEQY